MWLIFSQFFFLALMKLSSAVLFYITGAALTHLALQSQYSTVRRAHYYWEGGCLPVCETNMKHSVVRKSNKSMFARAFSSLRNKKSLIVVSYYFLCCIKDTEINYESITTGRHRSLTATNWLFSSLMMSPTQTFIHFSLCKLGNKNCRHL